MAARGAIAKEQITQQILEAFAGSFKYDKEIRIPIMENGELLQIKVSLTCAKTNVEGGSDTALPGEVTMPAAATPRTENTVVAEVTEEEKKNVMKAMAALGL